MLPRVYIRGTVIQADLLGVFNGVIDGAGIHVDQPLYAGGSKRAAMRQARAETAAAAAGLKVILNNVSAQVNLAYNALATDRERIRLNSLAAGQARENLRVVVVRYKNGDAIPTEVVDAQTALTAAEVRYYASVYSYLEGLARLEYAQGGDLSELLAQISQPPEADDQRIDLPRAPGKPPTAAPSPRRVGRRPTVSTSCPPCPTDLEMIISVRRAPNAPEVPIDERLVFPGTRRTDAELHGCSSHPGGAARRHPRVEPVLDNPRAPSAPR